MKKTIYIDMDDTIAAFSEAFKREININPSIQYPQSQYRFFANLAPITGAIDAVKALMASEEYEVYFLTAPSVRNPLSYAEKREWIEIHFGYESCKHLIICAHKHLLKGDLLVDDNANGKGQELFEGQLMHFGSKNYPDWDSIRENLEV